MNRPQLKKFQNGLSLIEIMVAMTISLVLMAAVLTILSSSKRTYALQDELGKLQENARFVFSELKKDLRMAGYYGCSGQINANTIPPFLGSANNQPIMSSQLNDSTGEVILTNQALARGGATLRNSDVLAINALPNVVTIDRALDESSSWNNLGQQEGRVTSWFQSNSNTLFFRITETPTIPRPLETIFIGDCSSTQPYVVREIVAETAIPGEGQITIQGTFGRTYSWPVEVMQSHSRDANINSAYQVGGIDKTGNGSAEDMGDGFGLFRNRQGNSVLFIEGVQNMQVLYGIDTDGDRVANTYSSQPNGTVVSVQVALLMRTLNRRLDFDDAINKQFNLLEPPAFNPSRFDSEDGFKHRVFTTTIKVRNS